MTSGEARGVAEHRLVDEARHPQGEASCHAHRRPAQPQRPEYPQLHGIPGKQRLQ